MYHLNDKDLDRLSKEAADQYDVDGDPSGWDKVGQMLDKEMPVKEDKDRRRWLLFLLLLVGLAGGGAAWLYSSSKEVAKIESADTLGDLKKTNDTKLGESPEDGTKGTNAESGVTKEKNDSNDSRSNNIINESGGDKPSETTLKNNDGNSKSLAPVGKIVPAEKDASAKSKPGQPQKLTAATTPNSQASRSIPGSNDKTSFSNKIKVSQQRVANRKKGSSDEEMLTNREPRSVNEPLTISKHHSDRDFIQSNENLDYADPLGTSAIVYSSDVRPNQPADTTPDRYRTQNLQGNASHLHITTREKGLEFGLVVAPDLTNVKFNTKSELGYNIGLQIGYRFNNRLSANTGLIYTKKNYSAQGKDFTAPPHYFIYYVDEFKSVDGYCEMFDIPLNIRYDVLSNNKRKLFVSSGISSYLMSGENYKYHYVKNGVYQTTQYDYPSSSKYFFSILNLSAGFEKAVSKRFSLQVEPYFKLPLKGVGFGSLDLNSYGVYFSLKYKPAFWK